MSSRLMLDTCVCINILRGKAPDEFESIKKFEPGDVVMSAITHSELVYGAFASKRTEYHLGLIEKLTDSFQVIDYCPSASMNYGKLRQDLSSKGILIGANDLLIAAHAIAEKCMLATHNRKEFGRVAGLKIYSF